MEIITKDLGWSDIPAGSSYCRCRSVQYVPRQHYNNQDEADSMICKLRQAESPGTKWFQSPQESKYFCDFTTDLWHMSTPRKCFIHPHALAFVVLTLSIEWLSRKTCSSVRTWEILCRVSVKRHLVLRTLRLKRFESSHSFRLAWSWVWDEHKSSGFLEE